MITATQNQLRHYILGKQGLLQRQPTESMTSFGFLHATDSATPYLSLLARVEPFKWEHLADKRYDEHAYERLRCMRGTLHFVPENLVETIKCAYRANENDPFPEFAQWGITDKEATSARFAILEAIDRHGPQSSATIKKYLGTEFQKKYKNKYGETTLIGPVMRWLWSLGLLESGVGITDWRQKEGTFRLSETAPAACDRAESDKALAHAYFELYAPASYGDWSWWCALKAERSKAAFDSLPLVEIEVEGMPEKLFMLAEQVDGFSQTPDILPEMVRMLPYEDALIKAYKTTRYRFYDEAGLAETAAFHEESTGEALPTVWVDGRIMGVWTWVRKPNEPMTVEPFHQMTRALRKRLKPEVERLQKFVQASHVIWSS